MSEESKYNRDFFIGTKGTTRHGQHFEVVAWHSPGMYVVHFKETGTLRPYLKSSIKRESIKDPNYPSIHGVGISDSYTHKKLRRVWYAMIDRCYNKASRGYRTYGAKGARVCKRWLRLSNLCEDMLNMENIDQYLADDGTGWSLDKDILKPGNKIYSPNYCRIVPKQVNDKDAQTRSVPGKALIINNITYKSIGEAARHLDIDQHYVSQIRSRAERNNGYYRGHKYEVEVI